MCFNFPSAKYSRLQSTLIKWSRQSLLDSDFQEHSTILLGMSGIARTLTTFSRRIAIPETSTRLGRATPQGTAPFDHLNTDMFMLLSHLNGLRNHEYFCMLMHMPSTHETPKMAQAGQADSQTPAPLLIKAPRARLWTLLVTDLHELWKTFASSWQTLWKARLNNSSILAPTKSNCNFRRHNVVWRFQFKLMWTTVHGTLFKGACEESTFLPSSCQVLWCTLAQDWSKCTLWAETKHFELLWDCLSTLGWTRPCLHYSARACYFRTNKQTNKQANKQTNKQTNQQNNKTTQQLNNPTTQQPNKPTNKPTNQQTNKQTKQPNNSTTQQPNNPTTNKPTNKQPNNSTTQQPNNPTTNKPTNKQPNNSTTQQPNNPTNQQTNKQTNQPTNKQTNKPTKKTAPCHHLIHSAPVTAPSAHPSHDLQPETCEVLEVSVEALLLLHFVKVGT